MSRRLVLTLSITLVAVAGIVVAGGRGTPAVNQTAQAQRSAATVRANRVALTRRTQRLERRVTQLETALSDAIVGRDASAPPALRREFSKLQAQLPGRIGVAFGAPNGAVTALGSFSDGPAWSTMKVPVAVAFIGKTGASSEALRRAITLSDNAAAMSLWGMLGRSDTARVARVERVLADAGDRVTRVQGQVVRPGFTPFGQTHWSLRAQQKFATRLPCLAGASQVLALMGRIDASQQWGLAHVGTRPNFKGGWGPEPGGAYLVRQFGLVHLRSGTVAVAIAAQPADGSFTTGVRYLDLLASWVGSHAVGGRVACR
jgi:hypothetical protein